MASTGARTLRLLALLQSRRAWSAAELAQRLEVSPRTVRRDVDRLRTLGYPVRSTPGIDGGYQLGNGASVPPLVLHDDEAVALAVALHDTASTGSGDLAEAAVLALAKLTRMLPDELRLRAEAVVGATVAVTWGGDGSSPSMATLAVLGEACRDGVRVDFGYTSRTGAVTQRRVEPYHLVTLGSRWYLLAFDGDRDDWRTFRVDRLAEPRALRNTFTRRPLPSDDVADYVREQIGQAAATHEVELELEAEASELTPWAGRGGVVEDLGGGRCRLLLRTDRLERVVQLLAWWPVAFTVIGPPELVDLLRSHAGHLLAHLPPGADVAASTAGD